MNRKFLIALVAAMAGAFPALSWSQTAATAEAQPDLIVLGASSLTDALNEIGPAFTAATHHGVKLSYAASSALARQVEAGAPADVFMSADTDWMDYLQTRHLIDTSTRHDVLGNRLVLISPADSTVNVKIGRHFRWPNCSATGGWPPAIRTRFRSANTRRSP